MSLGESADFSVGEAILSLDPCDSLSSLELQPLSDFIAAVHGSSPAQS